MRLAAALCLCLAAGPVAAGPMAWLDLNGDGRLEPFEAAAALAIARAESDADGDGVLDAEELAGHANDLEEELATQRVSVLEELDADGDGAVAEDELVGQLGEKLMDADADLDGGVSPEELERYLRHGELVEAADWVPDEVDAWFEGDADADGVLTRAERAEDAAALGLTRVEAAEERAAAEVADANGDGRLTRAELEADLRAASQTARFTVDGKRAELFGTIDAITLARLMRLVVEHPGVDELVLRRVPGTLGNQAADRLLSEIVHRHGFTVTVPEDGLAASGGTDLLMSGRVRRAHPTARIGVHSWSGLDGSGDERPLDDPEHGVYLEWFAAVGVPADFYWFTLRAASAGEMHWMTPAERERFGILPHGAMPEARGPRVRPPGGRSGTGQNHFDGSRRPR